MTTGQRDPSLSEMAMDVHTAIKNRRSVRAYASRTIPDDVMERIRAALRSAPSACNLQPWQFIYVMDSGLRQALGQAANGQAWAAGAPIIVVACALPGDAYQEMGGHGNSAEIDVAIALDHLTLAAVAEGLGTCWIGAFNEAEVKKLLGVRARAKVVALMPLGYPAEPHLNHPLPDGGRKPPGEVFSVDRYAG